MSAFNKFNCLVTDIAAGVHANAINADSDTLKVYLSNVAPNAATMVKKADLAEIANQNGYAAPVDIQNAAVKTVATVKISATDVVITAAGGNIGPFQYAVIYNDTPALKNLIGWYDHGTPVTLADTENFTLDFDGSLGFMTLA